MMPRLLALAALLFAFPAHAEVTIDWVTVGDPGNACDPQEGPPLPCYGAVAYTYQISKYEVTNAQYAEFLNAVAATDTNELYDTYMANPAPVPSGFGGITRSGSSGSYTYSAIAGRGNMPVNWVSFFDSLRFANWLHNGQPTGTQDNTTTEGGAYTIPPGNGGYTTTRNLRAVVVVPSVHEWYKAAYYDTGSMNFLAYPAGTDTETTCTAPGATPNTANCGSVVGDFTDVGGYTGSASPSGTFDQGGNVWEWNDTIFPVEVGLLRGMRGGGALDPPLNLLRASYQMAINPFEQWVDLGFRVAVVPPLFPQAIPALAPIGLLLVAAGLLGFGAYCRGRA